MQIFDLVGYIVDASFGSAIKCRIFQVHCQYQIVSCRLQLSDHGDDMEPIRNGYDFAHGTWEMKSFKKAFRSEYRQAVCLVIPRIDVTIQFLNRLCQVIDFSFGNYTIRLSGIYLPMLVFKNSFVFALDDSNSVPMRRKIERDTDFAAVLCQLSDFFFSCGGHMIHFGS